MENLTVVSMKEAEQNLLNAKTIHTVVWKKQAAKMICTVWSLMIFEHLES